MVPSMALRPFHCPGLMFLDRMSCFASRVAWEAACEPAPQEHKSPDAGPAAPSPQDKVALHWRRPPEQALRCAAMLGSWHVVGALLCYNAIFVAPTGVL